MSVLSTAYHSIPAPVDSWAEETERYLSVSNKLVYDDIDWDLARRVGVTDKEVFILTYFSDIEGQTINYMKDLLTTEAAKESDVIAFLTMWNYEEFFHGKALARFLKECGHGLEDSRIALVRKTASFSEKLESIAASVLSKVFWREFPAVHAAWGAVQEITTLHGYEQIQATTENPVLRILCDRIAKQERRHFAWYYNKAKERLQKSTRAQKLTYFLLSKFWSPVGAGVKTDREVADLIGTLFPGETALKMAQNVDSKIGNLPGLEGIQLMVPYTKRACG